MTILLLFFVQVCAGMLIGIGLCLSNALIKVGTR